MGIMGPTEILHGSLESRREYVEVTHGNVKIKSPFVYSLSSKGMFLEAMKLIELNRLKPDEIPHMQNCRLGRFRSKQPQRCPADHAPTAGRGNRIDPRLVSPDGNTAGGDEPARSSQPGCGKFFRHIPHVGEPRGESEKIDQVFRGRVQMYNLVNGEMIVEGNIVKIGPRFSAVADRYFDSPRFRNLHGIDLLHEFPDARLELGRRIFPRVERNKHRTVRRMDRMDSGNGLGFQKRHQSPDIKMMLSGNSGPERDEKRTVTRKLEARIPEFFGTHGRRLNNFGG